MYYMTRNHQASNRFKIRMYVLKHTTKHRFIAVLENVKKANA